MSESREVASMRSSNRACSIVFLAVIVGGAVLAIVGLASNSSPPWMVPVGAMSVFMGLLIWATHALTWGVELQRLVGVDRAGGFHTWVHNHGLPSLDVVVDGRRWTGANALQVGRCEWVNISLSPEWDYVKVTLDPASALAGEGQRPVAPRNLFPLVADDLTNLFRHADAASRALCKTANGGWFFFYGVVQYGRWVPAGLQILTDNNVRSILARSPTEYETHFGDAMVA